MRHFIFNFTFVKHLHLWNNLFTNSVFFKYRIRNTCLLNYKNNKKFYHKKKNNKIFYRINWIYKTDCQNHFCCGWEYLTMDRSTMRPRWYDFIHFYNDGCRLSGASGHPEWTKPLRVGTNEWRESREEEKGSDERWVADWLKN